MDDIINEDQFWENVYFELKKYGHRRVDPGKRIYHDNKDMARQRPTDVDELMFNRTWAITLAVENELWNWDIWKKRMEFVVAKLQPGLDDKDFATSLCLGVLHDECQRAPCAAHCRQLRWVPQTSPQSKRLTPKHH